MHSTPSCRRLLSVQAETSMQHGDNVQGYATVRALHPMMQKIAERPPHHCNVSAQVGSVIRQALQLADKMSN